MEIVEVEQIYYNSNTGTQSVYNLEVEISNNTLQRILWNNGGWLDDDHFDSVDLDEDGYCEFTSDKGYEYTVKIIGSHCSSNDLSDCLKDREDDENKIKCDRCGKEKSIYAEYCNDCLDAFCSNCGQFDDYKYTSYDLCSDCERKKEIKEKNCQRCGNYDYSLSKYDDYCDDCKLKKKHVEIVENMIGGCGKVMNIAPTVITNYHSKSSTL